VALALNFYQSSIAVTGAPTDKQAFEQAILNFVPFVIIPVMVGVVLIRRRNIARGASTAAPLPRYFFTALVLVMLVIVFAVHVLTRLYHS